MSPANPRVWLAVCAASAVLYMLAGAVARTSPGPITGVHANVAALNQGQSCSACHGGWTSTMSESCLACHEPIAAQLRDGVGLHGVVGEARAELCAHCHSEHHGASFAIINRQSFAVAGVAGPDGFDHAFVGFEMRGKHLEAACAKCHEHADAVLLQPGQARYLGLTRDCASCHEDAHQGRMTIGCAECHGQQSFDRLESMNHGEHTPLLGGHAEVACATCHAADTLHALDSIGRGRRVPQRGCADCHASAHAEEFVRGIAAQIDRPASATCLECHQVEHEGFAGEHVEVSPAQHAATGFALGHPHDSVACAKCHSGDTFAVRYPGRTADDCRSCHEDPHGGQFDVGVFADAGGCVACHARDAFEPHAFTSAKHAQTALELTGVHAELECRQCHADPTQGEPRQFDGTPARCEQCHDDAHRGFFERPPAAPLGDGAAGTCAHCHGTESFATLPQKFDHGHSTGFAIRGAHAQGECEICHVATTQPDVTGRKFGRVADRFGAFRGCETCHEDPHAGAFDRTEHPREIDGATGCARCHVEESFRSFANPFDHGAWTGFGLQGRHAEVGCSSCHQPLRQRGADGRTWAVARGRACADCHADPHAEQFARDGRTDCARCHTSTETFVELEFDHDRDARFSLGEAHAGAACSACHKPFQHGDRQVVRYRPIRRDCVDCHGSAQDPLRRSERRKS